jgi:hypothetical protein
MDNINQLQNFAAAAAGNSAAPAPEEEDDDDVPDLVEGNFEEASEK